MPEFTKCIWSPDPDTPGGRRNRTPFTYSAYVPDRIAELDSPLMASTAGLISEADGAVSGLNHDLPKVGGLEALARQLLRQESVASSRIEGLIMSHRRLARAAFSPLKDQADHNAQSILGNIRAMESAVAIAASRSAFTLDDLTEIHHTLLGATRDAHWAGIVRTTQNWIGGNNYNPRGADFVPPPPELVEELLNDLVTFLNRDDLPATFQAAIAHAQFETIHPFVDGNGRVGRCLIHVVFRRADLAPRYVPPISLVLAAAADDYVRGLTAYREDRIEEWCVYFGSAVLAATSEARRLAEQIDVLRNRWVEQAAKPRRGSTARRLIDALPGQPILDVATAADITGASQEGARRAVNALEEAGVIRKITVGRRNRAWEGVGIFDLINTFERELALPKWSSS